MLLLLRFLVGIFTRHDVGVEVKRKSNSPLLRSFFDEVTVYVAFLQGITLTQPLWEVTRAGGRDTGLLDLLLRVLGGLVSFEEAYKEVTSRCRDPLVFAFFVEVLTYLVYLKSIRMPDPLRIALEKWLRGMPPLPMDIDDIKWMYEYEGDGESGGG
jgi:hypothetical protein